MNFYNRENNKDKNNPRSVLTEQHNENQNERITKINKAYKLSSRMMPSKAKLTENFIIKNNKRLEKLRETNVYENYNQNLTILTNKKSDKKLINVSILNNQSI